MCRLNYIVRISLYIILIILKLHVLFILDKNRVCILTHLNFESCSNGLAFLILFLFNGIFTPMPSKIYFIS